MNDFNKGVTSLGGTVTRTQIRTWLQQSDPRSGPVDLDVLADVDVFRQHDFQQLAGRGFRYRERSIGDVSHAG
jgi:hypothetical protein